MFPLLAMRFCTIGRILESVIIEPRCNRILLQSKPLYALHRFPRYQRLLHVQSYRCSFSRPVPAEQRRPPYKVAAKDGLYCRNDAGTNKKALCLIPNGTEVHESIGVADARAATPSRPYLSRSPSLTTSFALSKNFVSLEKSPFCLNVIISHSYGLCKISRQEFGRNIQGGRKGWTLLSYTQPPFPVPCPYCRMMAIGTPF